MPVFEDEEIDARAYGKEEIPTTQRAVGLPVYSSFTVSGRSISVGVMIVDKLFSKTRVMIDSIESGSRLQG